MAIHDKINANILESDKNIKELKVSTETNNKGIRCLHEEIKKLNDEIEKEKKSALSMKSDISVLMNQTSKCIQDIDENAKSIKLIKYICLVLGLGLAQPFS